MDSDIEVPANLIELKREFIALDEAAGGPDGPDWGRLQEIALLIHRDPWWLEVENAAKARAAMTRAARAALKGS